MINIIRKFFATLLLSIFVFIMPSLLILAGIDAVFLNKSSVDKNLIPQSYEAVTGLVAEQFADNPQDASLFAKRIRGAISGDSYSELLRASSATFFNTLSQFKSTQRIYLDFSDVKEKLKVRLPEIIKNMENCAQNEMKKEEFRFCKPSQANADKNFEIMVGDSLNKTIPANMEVDNEKIAGFKRYIGIALLIKENLMFIIAGIGSALLLLIAFFIFSPVSSVLKWIGSSLISLALLLALFIFSVSRLPQVIPILEGLSAAQAVLIIFVVKQLAIKLLLFTFFIGGGGILFFGSGFILGMPRKHKSH